MCDLVVSQGADNTYRVRYGTDDGSGTVWADLTGWAGRAQMRYRAGGEVWVSLTSDAPTGHGSSLTLDADGYVTIHLHHSETEQPAWTAYARRGGVWDLELVNPAGEVVRLVMGKVAVSEDVTRDA